VSSSLLSYGSKGPRVRRLQKLLTGNTFRDFKPGPIDGEFGPRTASAVQRAKYVLGYRKQDLKPWSGDALEGYLSRKKPLTPPMKTRREIRRAREVEREATTSPETKMRRRAAGIIFGELGEMERGGNTNAIKYNDWWGWGRVPYCAIGISWAWVKAGSKAFVKGSRWAGTDAMLEDAKYHRHGLRLTSSPRRGCPGVIDFNGKADPDHAITFWDDAGNSMVETIEFNTGGPNGREGVWKKRRPMRNCWWFEVEK